MSVSRSRRQPGPSRAPHLTVRDVEPIARVMALADVGVRLATRHGDVKLGALFFAAGRVAQAVLTNLHKNNNRGDHGKSVG